MSQRHGRDIYRTTCVGRRKLYFNIHNNKCIAIIVLREARSIGVIINYFLGGGGLRYKPVEANRQYYIICSTFLERLRLSLGEGDTPPNPSRFASMTRPFIVDWNGNIKNNKTKEKFKKVSFQKSVWAIDVIGGRSMGH